MAVMIPPRCAVLALASACACAPADEVRHVLDGGMLADAGAVADVGDDASDPLGAAIPIGDLDAGACTWSPRRCGVRSEALAVPVGSPYGPLELQSVGVYYWNGFTVGTGLWFEGTVAGRPFVLSAERSNELIDGGLVAATPPGRYASGDSWSDLYARLLMCGRTLELHQAELVIDRHEVPHPIEVGSPIVLMGHLTVSDPGWSFEVPFQIEVVCDILNRT